MVSSTAATTPDAIEWPTLNGNPERTGSHGSVPGPGTGELLWDYGLPRGIHAPPAFDDGRIFVAYGGSERVGGGIHAVDAETGVALWTNDDIGSIYPPPVVSDGIVVVGTAEEDSRSNGRVVAYKTQDGSLVWEHELDGRSGEISIIDDIVYVTDRPTGRDGTLYALDLFGGEVMWSKDDVSNPRGYHKDFNQLIVVTSGGVVFSLDLDTRETSWENRVGVTLADAPSVSSGILTTFASEGPVALNAETGDVIWRHNLSSGPMSTSPMPIIDGLVLIPDNPMNVVKLDSGEVLNTIDMGMPHGVVVQESKAYFSTYTEDPSRLDPYNPPTDPSPWQVMAVDYHTGEIYWNHSLPYTYSHSTLINGILYQPYLTSPFGEEDKPGGIFALDAGYSAAVERGDIPGAWEEGKDASIIPMPSFMFLVGMIFLVAWQRRRCEKET